MFYKAKNMAKDFGAKIQGWDWELRSIKKPIKHLQHLKDANFKQTLNNKSFVKKKSNSLQITLLHLYRRVCYFPAMIDKASEYWEQKSVLNDLQRIRRTAEHISIGIENLMHVFYLEDKKSHLLKGGIVVETNQSGHQFGIKQMKSFRLWRPHLVKVNRNQKDKYFWLGRTISSKNDIRQMHLLINLCIREINHIEHNFKEMDKEIERLQKRDFEAYGIDEKTRDLIFSAGHA
jgi:hypothetical protein